MFLSAFGASKPLAVAPAPVDPLWANVQFLQDFETLSLASVPNPIPNQKSGVATTGTNPTSWYVSAAPSRGGQCLRSAVNTATTLLSSPRVTLPSALTGQFTVEWSMFRNGPDDYGLGDGFFGVVFNQSTNANLLLDKSINGATQCFRMSNSGVNSYGALAPSLNVWYDFAITRDASNLVRWFVNGTLQGSTTATASYDQFIVGTANRTGYYDPGNFYCDDVRITNVCRYTASYTPSYPFPTQ